LSAIAETMDDEQDVVFQQRHKSRHRQEQVMETEIPGDKSPQQTTVDTFASNAKVIAHEVIKIDAAHAFSLKELPVS